MNAEPAVSDILPDEPANLANSTKLLVTAADYFRDVGLHRQLTVKMDPEITNGLQRDHRGASIQRQIRVSKFLQNLARAKPY